MRKPQLPAALTDLAQPRTSRSRVRKPLIIIAALAAVMAALLKNRYVTGEAKVKQLIDTELDGVLVCLEDGKVFWAHEGTRQTLQTYVGQNVRPLQYRIDRFWRTSNGVPVGFIHTVS